MMIERLLSFEEIDLLIACLPLCQEESHAPLQVICPPRHVSVTRKLAFCAF